MVVPSALKVSALGTPGPNVLVGPGPAAIVSTYPGAPGQAYSVHNDATVQVAVPPNYSGSPVTYRVTVSIRDPQYQGMPTPSNPETDSYMDLKVTAGLPSDRPYILLANIVMPANTSAVTNAMINDARELTQPNELTVPVQFLPATNLVMSKNSYAAWAGAPQTVKIPDWTTHILAEAHINGIDYSGTDAAAAGVRFLMNASVVDQFGIIGSPGSASYGATRQSAFVLGSWTLQSGAGTNAQFSVQANQTKGTGNFKLDYQSQVLFRITFQQKTLS